MIVLYLSLNKKYSPSFLKLLTWTTVQVVVDSQDEIAAGHGPQQKRSGAKIN